MAAQSFSIKATHAATRDVRRATMQEESIDSLQEKLKALFNASQPFDLLYKDDEGDLVRFSSNEELNEALRVCAQTRVLHLVVCEEGQKPIEATAPPAPAFCPPHLMHHGPGPWMMRKAWMREDGPMGRACHGPRVFPGWRHGADGAKFFAAKLKAKAEALRAAVSTMDPKAPHRHHLADKLARVEMRLQTLEGQTANVSAEHQSAEHSAEACREDCGFRVHSNERVGGGTHCCRACKAGKGHGPACEQVAAEPVCEGEGCDFPVHPNMKIGGGTHCCGRCKAGKGHGPHCKGARSPAAGAAPAAKAEAKAKGGLKTTSLLATKDKLEAKLADPALKPHRRAKITDKIATLEAKLAENGDVEGAPQEGSNGLMNKPLAARFVTDVTLPKGSTVDSGALFSKTWRMRNVGTEPWPASTRLVMVGRDSDAMGAESEHPVPAAAPGDSVDITVEFVAPVDAGRYSSYWRLAHGEGQKFGQRVWLEVEVVSSSSSSSSSDYPLPSDDSADSDTCVIPAPAPSATFEADVATIVAMGFEPTLVRKVLGRCKGDLGRAVEKLVRKTQKAVRRADKVSEKKAKEHKRR